MATTESPNRLSLRPREAAESLGISERKLWALTKSGEIPAIRVGRGKRKLTLYAVSALEKWLAGSLRREGAHDDA